MLVPAGGGVALERDGVLLYKSHVELPLLVNGVARIDPRVAPSTVLAAGQEWFGDRGFEVLCLDGRDGDLRELAEAAGCRPGSPDPLQFLDQPPLTAPVDSSEICVRVATDASDVADVVSIVQDAHAAYGFFPEGVFASIFRVPETILSPSVHALILAERGRPVATAQAFLHEDLTYIGWVSVVQTAMHRGLGWLATEEAVAAGFARGARAAALMASPMGAPLYRKMGFSDVGHVRNAYAQPGKVLTGLH